MKLLESFSFFFPSMVFTRKGSCFFIFQSHYYFRIVKKTILFRVSDDAENECFTLGPSPVWKMKLWL